MGSCDKKTKIRPKEVVNGSRDLLLEFWDRLHISGIMEARNFEFGMQIDQEKFLRKTNFGVVKRSRDLLLKFWDPSISRERLDLEATNFLCILNTRGRTKNSKKQKFPNFLSHAAV